MDGKEAEVKQVRIITFGFVSVLFVLITGVSSCVMQNQLLEVDIASVKIEHLKVQTLQEKEQIDAIKILIDKGINPVAARCSIIGWESERDSIVCSVVGVKSNINEDDIKK